MNIHYLQHVSFEGLGALETWARGAGHTVSGTRLHAGEGLPEAGRADMVIVMGGPMSLYGEVKPPWLTDEKRFIERSIRAGKQVLGICLGAQLIADTLGARVYRNEHREIGWHEIEILDTVSRAGPFAAIPRKLTVFQWHGDTFDLPAGAEPAATSVACRNQAFVYNRTVIGLQFHLETTHTGAGELIENCGHEIVDAPYIQQAHTIMENGWRFETIQSALFRFMDAFEDVALT
jgi:GMP synthase (glutamine-hydrolysing)